MTLAFPFRVHWGGHENLPVNRKVAGLAGGSESGVPEAESCAAPQERTCLGQSVVPVRVRMLHEAW